MMENCLNEGVIQAFLDGELAADAIDKVTRHIALCDDCAILLGEAEEESAFAYTALEQEFNTLVPTHRLWTKINTSIEEERKSNSFWHRFLAAFSAVASQLARPSVAAFASLLLVVGTFSALWVLRPMPGNNAVAVQDSPYGVTEVDFGSPIPPAVEPQRSPLMAVSNDGNEKTDNKIKVIQTNNRENNRENSYRDNRPRLLKTNNYKQKNNQEPVIVEEKPSATTLAYIPGEESYVKTISTLKTTFDSGKDLNLKPSERFAFEKDMAVIDDAISKMKAEVSKNPKNDAARQVLFASYQNKIDLLNSVSERNELIASIR